MSGTTVYVAWVNFHGGDPEVRVFLDCAAAERWAAGELRRVIGDGPSMMSVYDRTSDRLFGNDVWWAYSCDGDDCGWVKSAKLE